MDINNAKTVGAPTRKPRTKLTAINNFLMCFVCKGYIIEATAVSECLHSFCRSCIVKHLLKEKHCPKCKLTPISIASLRPDDIIKSLVYKVVPGLFQSECQRRDTYNLQNGQPFVDDSLPGDKAGRKQYYFAPDEPISLSLTYDTESLVGSGITSAPPINYLQCPAAVTVHHLKRFVSAKYGINAERDVNIEIICEDEVLPGEFTLMDVAYCFNWTRVLPMDLLFRILLNPNANRDAANKPKEVPVALENDNNHNRVGKKPAVGQIQTADKNNGGFQVSKENYNYRTRDVPKTVRFDLPGPEPVVALTQMTSKLGSPAKKEPEGDFKRLRSSNSASSPPSSNGASVSSEKKTKPIAPPATKKAETLQLQVKYEEEKKCYSNPKKEKKEVPKLKIDLPNMKAQLVEEPKQPKLVLKLPSPLRTEPQQLPLEEYAKKIGLQPVQRKHEESHRKRKNKKHSKEPNKKRKLHAEVSSLTLNDEVKLKVKITTKEKSRSSAVSEEKLSVKDVEVPSVSPKPAPVVAPAEEVKATSLLRAVRKPMVFIPNAPKIATDPESDVIAEIVSRMKQPQAPPPKAPTPTPTPVTEKPRASPPMPPPKPPMSRPTLSANPLASLRPPSMAKLPQKPTNGPKPPAIPHVPVLMPQFSQASMLDIRMQRMNSAPRGLAPRPPPQRLPMMAPRPPKRAMTDTQPPMGSKTPRLDLMEISAQNRLMKKQVYVPSLMEMGKKMEEKSKVVLPKKPSPVPQKPTSAPPKTTPVPQKASPVPQTAPQKTAPGPQKPSGDAAKKLPRLIAPSSISVTKVGESSSTPAPQSHRPAVEILKISSSAPTIDKPAQAPQPKPKANRPPPPNIPLDKIRKSFPGGLFKLDQALDLSSPKGVRADLATLELQRADPVQSVRNALDSLRQNETQNGNGETAKKSSVRKMDTPVIDLTDSSSDSRPVSSAATEKKMPPLTRPPMPKLKPVRQQNLSVRNVPNPSALVFRNQAQGVPSKPVSAPMKSPPPVSKLSEKIHQLHQMQNQRKITPED